MDVSEDMKHLTTMLQDEVDGAFCGKRRASDCAVPEEPKTFEINVPDSLDVGSIIKVEGAVPFGIELFQVNLYCENDIIALHLSMRFRSRIVVRNSFQGGAWETEEIDGPFPFSSGTEFSMHILVQPDGYYIAVNGQHCWVFNHRLPYSGVTAVNVFGPVKIHGIEFSNVTNKDYDEASDALFLRRVDNPSIPFTQTIPGGLKPGMKISINGRPFVSVHRFTINFQCGTGPYPPPEIAFHFDARAYNHCIVRNTRRNNNWEEEEVSAPSFPFQPGVNFDIVINVESDKFVVTVNGKHFTDYIHRITQLSSIDTLKIENDVVVACVTLF